MKTTLALTAAIAAFAGTQVFAANVKEGTITFSLTGQRQTSVSTSNTKANQGNWTDGPSYYKTASLKITQADIIKDIVATWAANDTSFSTFNTASAKLVLVQGELSGFFTMTPNLSNSVPIIYTNEYDYGYISTADGDDSTVIGNATDSLYTALPNGRTFETNPITGVYPIGHLQPWGQIYLKWTKGTNSYYENVTYFFGLTVQECYDCFYLNSFISQSSFNLKKTINQGRQSGPPCCSVASSTNSVLLGSGRDSYYLTLNFDDTQANPYLNPDNTLYTGYTGITPDVGRFDGLIPDLLPYSNPITSAIGTPSDYEARFTLNGILSYGWTLKFVNSTDLYPDFVGSASYSANGFGFIQLYCTLLTGSASISESIIKAPSVDSEESDSPYQYYWADNWFPIGEYTDLYNIGATFNSEDDSYDSNYTIGALNSNVILYFYGYTVSTPFNTGANLTYHASPVETYEPHVSTHALQQNILE